MKALTLTFTLFLLSITFYGQKKQNLHIGIIAGPSISNLYGSLEIQKLNKPSIHFTAGLSAEVNCSKHISLCTNLLFERLGTVGQASNNCLNLSHGEGSGDYTASINFNYISLPILVRYKLGNRVKYFVNVGPNIGYLVKQDNIIAWEHFDKSVGSNIEDYEKINMGISSGIGTICPLSDNLSFQFELRNNCGLKNIYALTDDKNIGTIKTNSLSALMGFVYHIKESKAQNSIQTW